MLFILLLLTITFESSEAAETPYRSVRITANVHSNPTPSIRLQWNYDSTATQYIISKKLPNSKDWINLASVGQDTVFIDSTVDISKEYEYQVVKLGVRNNADYAFGGCISAGIQIPFEENRGIVAVVVDSTTNASITEEIATFLSDHEGDGWLVRKIVTSRSEKFDGKKARAVKREIQRIYDADSTLKAVVLLGRIAVPYSGNFVVDDHEDHLGAWPADCYYGDVAPSPLDERWSDLYVLDTIAAREANRNRRIDGKFDQSEIPSDIELAVGRIDFFDLPLTGVTETEILRQYLHRNHAYRHGLQSLRNAASIWDRFDVLGNEMFAQSAYSNSTSIFGNANIVEERWLGSASDSAFQFAFAAGPGNYVSCWDIGSIEDAKKGVNAVFCSMLGSYYGDWDNSDNLMRSVLAGSNTLAIWWSGRPQWQLHRCAAGQPLGISELTSVNNDGILYDAGRFTRGVHIALLGDPTLRFFPVPSPRNVNVIVRDSIIIRWTPPSLPIDGYFVYRDDGDGFKRLNQSLINETAYTEAKPDKYSASTRYMVRAVLLQTTPSGSFWNPSQGAFSPAQAQNTTETAAQSQQIIITPMPVEEYCDIEASQINEQNITLVIADMLGRIIATPDRISANLWRWKAHGVASGAYTAVITAQQNIFTRLVLKK